MYLCCDRMDLGTPLWGVRSSSELVVKAFLLIMKTICTDITKLTVDAIVNAANSSLLGGGGVDGAIHLAAGPELLIKCRTLGGCNTGEAKITGGYLLPVNYVIHTVGPVWHGGHSEEEVLLASCYQRCCEIAAGHQEISSIAFPCISTGVYRFPFKRAANIAVDICARFANSLDITFCCFSERDSAYYQDIINT